MKKILLVAYSFPPIQTVESTLTFNFVKYLNCFDWGATVLCAKKTMGERVDVSAPLNAPKNVLVYKTRSIGNILVYILQRLKVLSHTYSRIGWFPFAMKRGKKILEKDNIDIIISRSTPIVSHLVALGLKSFSKLYWIACFSDPWTQSSYSIPPNRMVKKIDEHLEKKIMLSADKIIVTSEQTKRLFLEKYNIADKIEVIPNSYDSVEPFPKINNRKEDKFIITHAGNFYGPRSPEPFFKGLKLLIDESNIAGKIIVKFIGQVEEVSKLVSKYKLENVVQLINTVPRIKALEYLIDSDVLLLIDAPSSKESVFLPSKLIEYINMNKPILAVVPAGASADVVVSTKTGIVVALDNEEGIKGAIYDYYKLYEASRLEIKPDWVEIRKYDAKNCAEALIKIAEKLIQ